MGETLAVSRHPKANAPASVRARLRSTVAVVTAVVTAMAAGVTSCSRSGEDSANSLGAANRGSGPTTFADVDAAMGQRMADDALPGGAVLVVQHGKEVHRATYGGYSGREAIPIASASKWLTAALAMILVDEGELTLDDPIAGLLPAFANRPDSARITLRHLLSHSSGIRDHDCTWDRTTTLAACSDLIAAAPLENEPGTEFHYGNTSYQVAARLIEVGSGQRFEDLFQQRLARPLGMTVTRFDEGRPTDNPTPAASGQSSLDDYAAFLALMAGRGTFNGTRLLSEAAVDELLRNQAAGHENRDDFAVQITNVPQYGLGMWLDKVEPDGHASVASGSGSLGFYPWIDRRHDAYGIIEVYDRAGGNGHAVRTSQRICYQAIAATPTT